MNNNKIFIFQYPITDFTKHPAIHFTDLTITAEAIIGREITTSIKSIRYTERGNGNSCKIMSLLKVVAPELYKDIKSAAQEKAVDEFEEKCIAQFK